MRTPNTLKFNTKSGAHRNPTSKQAVAPMSGYGARKPSL
jgi:hypothetical protein